MTTITRGPSYFSRPRNKELTSIKKWLFTRIPIVVIATASIILMMRKVPKTIIGITNTCTLKIARMISAKYFWRMPELIVHRPRLISIRLSNR